MPCSRLFAARASVEMERDALERLYVAQSVLARPARCSEPARMTRPGSVRFRGAYPLPTGVCFGSVACPPRWPPAMPLGESADGWLLAVVFAAVCLILLLRRAQLRRHAALAARSFMLLDARLSNGGMQAGHALESISTEIGRYRKAMEALQARRKVELVGRVEAERGLQQLEERYGLAIRGVDDALWEWNLKTIGPTSRRAGRACWAMPITNCPIA